MLLNVLVEGVAGVLNRGPCLLDGVTKSQIFASGQDSGFFLKLSLGLFKCMLGLRELVLQPNCVHARHT